MLTMDFTVEELAHESIELLPERDTMQPVFAIGNSIATAVNFSAVDQSASAGATATVTQGAEATATASVGDVTINNVSP
jgi:hypothetical protein